MTLQDELQMMLEKTRRYIKSAAVLQLEGDYDSAISRLYYAMFYYAEALLLAKGHSFSSHRAVISAFAQHYVKWVPSRQSCISGCGPLLRKDRSATTSL
jgi:uncharacterized protein